uniref:Uncharacterized protein n=1 Tax=Oryza punctata TaxID=4537 RepID=A0A0E0K289_ORYPU
MASMAPDLLLAMSPRLRASRTMASALADNSWPMKGRATTLCSPGVKCVSLNADTLVTLTMLRATARVNQMVRHDASANDLHSDIGMEPMINGGFLVFLFG